MIGVVGDGRQVFADHFVRMAGVAEAVKISKPYKLASREFHPENTEIPVNGVQVGSKQILVIAGPCSVESREQIMETALTVRESGAHALRGGAYKPRSSPYSFQGMGEEGLQLLAEAREATGLPIVTEVLAPEQVPLIARYADVLQIGSRNMQNFALLNAVGASQRPVLLKRGLMSTIDELLMAAEYILSNGNRHVMLCERGIRTYEQSTRNTTDINAIPVLKALTHLPVILDPSHSTGHWELVTAVAHAGIAAGADGLIVEVHPNPDVALSDGGQSLKPKRFTELIEQVEAVAKAVGRTMERETDKMKTPTEFGGVGFMNEPDFTRTSLALPQAEITIIGLGLMGGSLAQALRGKCRRVTGYDPDPETRAYAAKQNIVDRFAADPTAALSGAQVVILAAPIQGILAWIERLMNHQQPAFIIDIGSTKVAICQALTGLPVHLAAVGGHPMCGKERAGIAHADPTLFQGAPFSFVRLSNSTTASCQVAKSLAHAVGAHPVWIDAATHDRWTAATSHVPYLLASALIRATPLEASP